MEISLIGTNAGSVWNALHAHGELELTKLKKKPNLLILNWLQLSDGWPAKVRC